MKLTEKMSYLKGLLDGMEIDDTTKEGKALIQMADVMQEMVGFVDDLQSQMDELYELCDILDSDLGSVEEDIYGSDECGCDECEDDSEYETDELYEACCPECGNTVVLDEFMIEEGSVECPECGSRLEFDFDDIEDDDTDNE